jgi:hypothetical protein
MSKKTFGDLRSLVRRRLDLLEESFILPQELIDYTEEAIKECEAEIHKFNAEDQYFLAQAPIALRSGQSDYSLPSNIYANKIIRLVYANGSSIHTIPRSKNHKAYETRELLRHHASTSSPAMWEYSLYNNDVRTGTKLRIYPTPQETSVVTTVTGNLTNGSRIVTNMSSTAGISKHDFVTGTGLPAGARVESIDSATQVTLTDAAVANGTNQSLTFTEDRLTLWYIRKAAIPSVSSDVIDIPEFWNFISQYVVVECLKKELGNPRITEEKAKLEFLRTQMHDTLSEMVPDQDDNIEKDLEFYHDMEVGSL